MFSNCFSQTSENDKEDLSYDTPIPIICEVEMEMKSFVMGFHEYRVIWTPKENDVLHAHMEPGNKKDSYAVAVHGEKNAIVGHLMKGKSGRFAKTIFYFLQANEHHECTVRVTGKAVNQGDTKGMKVPCILMFKGQREYVDVLNKELKKYS